MIAVSNKWKILHSRGLALRVVTIQAQQTSYHFDITLVVPSDMCQGSLQVELDVIHDLDIQFGDVVPGPKDATLIGLGWTNRCVSNR